MITTLLSLLSLAYLFLVPFPLLLLHILLTVDYSSNIEWISPCLLLTEGILEGSPRDLLLLYLFSFDWENPSNLPWDDQTLKYALIALGTLTFFKLVTKNYVKENQDSPLMDRIFSFVDDSEATDQALAAQSR